MIVTALEDVASLLKQTVEAPVYTNPNTLAPPGVFIRPKEIEYPALDSKRMNLKVEIISLASARNNSLVVLDQLETISDQVRTVFPEATNVELATIELPTGPQPAFITTVELEIEQKD